jgi:hypothetical protein
MRMGFMSRLRCLIAICVFATALLAADNPFVGTWKLNLAKSKFAPGTQPKEVTVVFEAAGDQIKRVVTGVDEDGQPINENDTIAWDGQDHGINQPGLTVAVTKISDRAVKFALKREGKVLASGRATVSKDGKSIISTEKGEDLKGRKLDSVETLEKQ